LVDIKFSLITADIRKKDPMDNSVTAFIGTIPEYYDRYFGPIIFEDYAVDLVRRVTVPTAGTVLEIAAGTGIVTHHLRNTLPENVKIIATDLNESMLDYAQTKFNNQQNIEFQPADATELSFRSASIDTVISQFSLMFFQDKQIAIEEIARILKPGGEFIFNIWDSFEHNHLLQSVNQALIGVYPDNPPSFFDIPYGYYKIDKIKDLLDLAGFGGIEISILPGVSQSKTARQVALATILGTPASIQIAERGEIEVDRVVDIVEEAISAKYGPTSVAAKMQAIVFKACKPG